MSVGNGNGESEAGDVASSHKRSDGHPPTEVVVRIVRDDV